MEFKYFSKNGEMLPIEGAMVPLSNIEYQYGFGVYENVRVANGVPYFLKDHLGRLAESARIIGLQHPFSDTMIYHSVEELVKKTGKETYNLKILLIGGAMPVGQAGGRQASLCILPLNPRFPDKKLYRDGAHFITYEYERPFPRAKTLNMLQSYLAYKEAQRKGAYDALLINAKGCIVEGTRTNFFAIEGETLVSPPEDEILLGVTRKKVLGIAQEIGFALEEREMRFGELERADGAFITSTSSKIVPVRSIDNYTFGAHSSALRELMDAFDAFLAEYKKITGSN